jgi:hypothetical protein
MSSASMDLAIVAVSFVQYMRRRRTDSIIHGLIDGRANPAPLPARHNNLRDFECGVVAEPELLELALFVELVDGL